MIIAGLIQRIDIYRGYEMRVQFCINEKSLLA